MNAARAVFVCLAAGTWMIRFAPDLLEERLTAAERAPRWDVVILRTYSAAVFALLLVAALDAGRLRFSHVPVLVQVIGFVMILVASAVVRSCVRANRYLSSHMRIQADRQQQVVQSGPYRVVRHPMYGGIILLVFGIALALGSWLALIPVAVVVVLFVLRTWLEDRMLTSELGGYAQYAVKVRYRLLPGVWY